MTTNLSPQDYDVSQEKHIQNFAKHMLQGRLFMGIYQEKRYVEKLNSYRDIILINNAEKDLIHDLNVVFKRISDYYTTEWLGITTPDTKGSSAGYSLWVNLQKQVFGCYWYKIKGIEFKKGEIFLCIKQVRPVAASVEQKDVDYSISNDAFSSDNFFNELKEIAYAKLKDFSALMYGLMTLANIRDTIIFISILIFTIMTGLLHACKYLLEFALKLLREISILTKSATPIAIACIKMCEKIIGGFYILIAMLWRDTKYGSKSRPHQMQTNRMQPIEYTNYRSRSYGRATITELEH